MKAIWWILIIAVVIGAALWIGISLGKKSQTASVSTTTKSSTATTSPNTNG